MLRSGPGLQRNRQRIAQKCRDDPSGFLEVDKNTLVFSIGPTVPVKEIICDMHMPAGMVWKTTDKERADYIEANSEKLGSEM